MKVYDSINPKEGIEIGAAQTAAEAEELLRTHYDGTGEDRLYGVTTADFNIDFSGEVFVPRLKGIN